ncbi:MAG: hydrogenase maturation nickel metallochaperone HypA, partial [Sulfurospirillum sp.]|nr:hydrogenase maturation nickel metallochaperone HypA [Sulfurospirillum sp.]
MCARKRQKKHHAKAIERIEIALGRLSGVEPHLLQSSFDTFKEETLCEEATLVI